MKTYGFDLMDDQIQIRGRWQGDYEDPDHPKKTWKEACETLFKFFVVVAPTEAHYITNMISSLDLLTNFLNIVFVDCRLCWAVQPRPDGSVS